MPDVRIAGITPFTTVDWPGKLACVAWLAGCPWRCPYCHNHGLWDASSAQLGLDDLLDFLRKRQRLLDGVVFSGGEPTAQPGLADAVRAVHDLGFAVGLHTGGAYPEALERLLPHLSWVGFDVKAPWESYDLVTLSIGSAKPAQRSLQLVLDAGIPMEARTTWHPDLLTSADMDAIAAQLAELHVPAWRVQAYRAEGAPGSLANRSPHEEGLSTFAKSAIPDFEFRKA